MSENTPAFNSNTQLYSSNYGSGSVTFSPVGSQANLSYNAVGFNPNDDYLYAIEIGTDNLVQIDSTGTATRLGEVANLPAPIGTGQAFYTGAFDGTAPGANFWVTRGVTSANGSGVTKFAYEINVTTRRVIDTLTFGQSKSWEPADWTASGGFMWGLETNSNKMDRLNLSTGSIDTFTVAGLQPSSYWGAAWTLGNGNLTFASNGNGNVYQIAIANPASISPTFTVVARYDGRDTQANDGAACVSPPVDLGIAKTGPAVVSPSGTITWTLRVTNNGPGSSTGFVVSDAVPPGVTNVSSPTAGCTVVGNNVQCSEGALANGGTFNITVTGRAPPTFGTCFTNTASVTGNEADPISSNNSSSLQTCTSPAIQIVKSASISSFSTVGTAVTYSYRVTNPATSVGQSLSGLTVTDPMPGLSTITCPVTTLGPGASTTCTATYTTTQADVDRGSISNTGTATATPIGGGTVSAQSSLTIPGIQTPAITLAKTANPTTFSAPGVVITYSYLVTNSGNVTLHAVGVTDPLSGLSAINCGVVSTLAPGASKTCTATYTTTQADVDSGSVSNTGTATGTSPNGVVVNATASRIVLATRTPSISVVKTANVSGFSAPGTAVTYSYLVTNTGNVTLTSVGVTDPLPGLSAVNCGVVSTLAPGSSRTCTATYTTTQADVNKGSVTNTGTASGTGPNGATVTATSTVTIPATQTPSISVVKSASAVRFASPGAPITYRYLVTNTGNVTLQSIDVTDPHPGLSAVTCPISTLPPGQSETCTATYTTTQADVDAGGITNTGTAHGTPPTGAPVTAQSTLTIPLSQSASIGLAKSASITSFSTAGTAITYSYLVTNPGNVTLTSVQVTDPLPGLSAVTCPSTTLAPNASETCTATYTTTQADVDRGSVNNTGTATGTPPTGPPVTHQSSVTVPATVNPAIRLVKSASITGFSAVGTPVTYSYLVTNTGNVTLTSVQVTDPMAGLSAVTCPNPTLAPGASEICTATYTTTQADLDRGGIANTGTATGTPPSPRLPVTDQSGVNIAATRIPAISLAKTASPTTFSGPGVVITYSYAVTNTGNVTLTSVHVTDPMSGLSAVNCPNSSLAPGVSETCTATYTTTQADVDRGSIVNTGTAAGTPPNALSPVTATSSATVTASLSPCDSGGEDGQRPVVHRRRDLDHLQLRGHQHRQRHPDVRARDRSDARPVSRELSEREPGPGRLGDLHRDVHHHPDRPRSGKRHQHRNRLRHRGFIRTDRDRVIDGDRAGHPGPGDQPREVR